MKKDKFLKEIQAKAKVDQKNRNDLRFIGTMGFLVAKGFLHTNLNIPLTPNKRINIEDALWAGKNVEPRILEVLPAAILRFRKHFNLNAVKHPEAWKVVEQLRKGHETGDAFYEMPFEKLKPWVALQLKDRRVKSMSVKKITKTFRLSPRVIDRLKTIAQQKTCTETQALEDLILKIF